MTRVSSTNQDRVHEMYRAGLTYREISARTGLARGTVARELVDQRKEGRLPALKDRDMATPFYLSGATLARIKEEAIDRGTNVRDLVERLLTNVAKDDLFNAVLEE